MRTIVLINLAVVVGSAFAQDMCIGELALFGCDSTFAQDTCTEESAWIGCVSTRTDAACLPLSIATSIPLSCGCNGLDISYSCAKTYCSGDTSFQSQLLDSFDSCTYLLFNPAAVPTTEAALTSPITQSSSTAVPSASNTPIPTSTRASSASNTSSTTDTTSALGTTTSVATSQALSTTSASKAAANLVLTSNGGLGRFLAFVAGMAALI